MDACGRKLARYRTTINGGVSAAAAPQLSSPSTIANLTTLPSRRSVATSRENNTKTGPHSSLAYRQTLLTVSISLLLLFPAIVIVLFARSLMGVVSMTDFFLDNFCTQFSCIVYLQNTDNAFIWLVTVGPNYLVFYQSLEHFLHKHGK